MKAIFNGKVIAQSGETIEVEGNHYFPPQAVNREFLKESSNISVCPWKGKATYFDVEVGGQIRDDAAWTYKEPSAEAAQIKDHVAFWKGVHITED